MKHHTHTRIQDIKGSTGSHPGIGEALRSRLELACEQLHRKYLAVPILALTLMLMLRYLRLLIGVIPVRRWEPSLLVAYPNGVSEQIIHDCRFAVFRRRAVCQTNGRPSAKLPRRGLPITDYHTKQQ